MALESFCVAEWVEHPRRIGASVGKTAIDGQRADIVRITSKKDAILLEAVDGLGGSGDDDQVGMFLLDPLKRILPLASNKINFVA